MWDQCVNALASADLRPNGTRMSSSAGLSLLHRELLGHHPLQQRRRQHPQCRST